MFQQPNPNEYKKKHQVSEPININWIYPPHPGFQDSSGKWVGLDWDSLLNMYQSWWWLVLGGGYIQNVNAAIWGHLQPLVFRPHWAGRPTASSARGWDLSWQKSYHPQIKDMKIAAFEKLCSMIFSYVFTSFFLLKMFWTWSLWRFKMIFMEIWWNLEIGHLPSLIDLQLPDTVDSSSTQHSWWRWQRSSLEHATMVMQEIYKWGSTSKQDSCFAKSAVFGIYIKYQWQASAWDTIRNVHIWPSGILLSSLSIVGEVSKNRDSWVQSFPAHIWTLEIQKWSYMLCCCGCWCYADCKKIT